MCHDCDTKIGLEFDGDTKVVKDEVVEMCGRAVDVGEKVVSCTCLWEQKRPRMFAHDYNGWGSCFRFSRFSTGREIPNRPSEGERLHHEVVTPR